MASDDTQGVSVNTTLIGTGAVLALFGSLLIAVGMALGGTALIAAAHEWARRAGDASEPDGETEAPAAPHGRIGWCRRVAKRAIRLLSGSRSFGPSTRSSSSEGATLYPWGIGTILTPDGLKRP